MEVPESMKNLQLDLAVTSINWSYAIYWSLSSTQPGVLEWLDGYYNGDIKSRKSVQDGEPKPERTTGLQRSKQLRELYESLYGGEDNAQVKRPSATLSPEDLTDTEWYYLVCMSFVFNIGQGLPGRTLAKNRTIWLCNAHHADTELFSRSILAKSASIKTVVCFPHLGGVIELGVTKHVLEDQNLIQQIKACLLEIPVPDVSKNPDKNVCVDLDHNNVPETDFDPLVDCGELYICSPNNSCNSFGANQLIDESNVFEGIDEDLAQLESWQYMGENIGISCVNNSVNSSDCVSQTYENPRKMVPIIKETRECYQEKGDEIHYQSVLSNLLKGSNQFILGPYFGGSKRESSFVSWTKDRSSNAERTGQTQTPQRLLKKVLIEVARMHENSHEFESSKNNEKSESPSIQAAGEIDRNHVLSERKRREKISERFTILGSLVPSGGKADKVSILDNAIQYLRVLERRVKELEESSQVAVELESGARKPPDATERTSDNYGTAQNSIKKPLTNKRKASDLDRSSTGNIPCLLRNSSRKSITVDVGDKDVSIEIQCHWRGSLLIEVMEAISKLHLDSTSVQSFSSDGMLSLTIKAQLKGSKLASKGVIRRAIQKVIWKV